jgi:hypothetical protein
VKKEFARPPPKKQPPKEGEERFTLLLQKLALDGLQSAIDAELGIAEKPRSETTTTAALKDLDDLLNDKPEGDRNRAATGNTAAIDELDALLRDQ